MNSVSKVYQKFGINIRYRIPGTDRILDFATPDLKPTLKNFKGGLNRTDTLKVIE